MVHRFCNHQSKRQAENLVIKARGRVLGVGNPEVYDDEDDENKTSKGVKDGKKHLSTLSLWPNVLYGEKDLFYVTNGLKLAQKNNGILYRFGDGRAKFQQAYVGNVAYAHVCAMAALSRDSNLGGKVINHQRHRL